MTEQDDAKGRDQQEVLDEKGHALKSSRGLQLWGDEGPSGDAQRGQGAEGTAERAARITRAQRKAEGNDEG